MRIFSAIAAALGVACLLTGCANLAGDERPAIHVAAGRNDTAVVHDWIRRGRDIDYEFNDRRITLHGGGARIRRLTPLMVAAERRNFETVKLLVEAGADIYHESTRADGEGEGIPVFDYAVEGGDVRIIRYLWNVSDKRRTLKHLEKNFLRAFEHACYNFPHQSGQELLQFFLSTFDRKHASEALRKISDRQACMAAIRFILDEGVAPSQDALITAASYGMGDIIALYLQRGASVNGYGRTKVTPLIAAAQTKQVGAMRLLLKSGADPNLQDSDGRTALIAIISESACFRVTPACDKQVDAIKLLLEAGARTDIVDRQQKTAMDYTARYSDDAYKEIKRTLLGAQVR